MSHINDSFSYVLISPNREKIISKSSSVVTGLSLHTNKTFRSGFQSFLNFGQSDRSTNETHRLIRPLDQLENGPEHFHQEDHR